MPVVCLSSTHRFPGVMDCIRDDDRGTEKAIASCHAYNRVYHATGTIVYVGVSPAITVPSSSIPFTGEHETLARMGLIAPPGIEFPTKAKRQGGRAWAGWTINLKSNVVT